MPETPQRVRIDEIDWRTTFRFTRIFRSFRMAIHPSKLFTSLLLVVLLYLCGTFLDAVMGPSVDPDEIANYQTLPWNDFQEWREGSEVRFNRMLVRTLQGKHAPREVDSTYSVNDRLKATYESINQYYAELRAPYEKPSGGLASDEDFMRRRVERLAEIESQRRTDIDRIQKARPRGVFAQSTRALAEAFARFVNAASTANFGVMQVLRNERAPSTVAGALREMIIVIPGWAMFTHPVFFFVYFAMALSIWALVGGAVARMAALHATRDERISFLEAIVFAGRYWPWFIIAPLLIPVIAGAFCMVIYLLGLLAVGIPYARVATAPVGGLLFGVVLGIAFIVTILTVALASSHTLLYPGLAVEGTDGFDANSRAVGYVIARPWHLLFYNAVMLVYGALTYLFVMFVVYLTLMIVQFFIAAAAGAFSPADGAAGFQAVMPAPEVGQLSYEPDWSALNISGKITAVLVMVWVYLFVMLLAAYAISFFFSSQTQIYLLLRRSADGTDFEEVYIPPAAPESEPVKEVETKAVPDKVEGGGIAVGKQSTPPPASAAPTPPAPPSNPAPDKAT